MYSRNQTKLTVDQLINEYKNSNIAQQQQQQQQQQKQTNSNTVKKIPFKKRKFIENLLSLFYEIDEVYFNCLDQDQELPIVVSVLLGSSLFNLKEVYLFYFGTFKDYNNNEPEQSYDENGNSNGSNNIKLREIMLKLVVNSPDSFLVLQRPLKVNICIYKKRNIEINENSNQDQQQQQQQQDKFIPNQEFQIKIKKSTKVTVFNFTNSNINDKIEFRQTEILFKNINSDNIGNSNQDSLNNSTMDIDINTNNSNNNNNNNNIIETNEDYLWYQFHTSINGIS